MKPIVERFFRYVGIDTQSTWEAETVPASSNEFVLGQMLVAVSYTHLTLPTICSV